MKQLFAILLIASVFAFGVSKAANTATIAFGAVTQYTDDTTIATAVTYNVYQGAKGSTTKAKVGTITALTTTISVGLQTGQEYCFEVTAVAGGVEGAKSNEACKKFVGTPGIVTITVT